MDGKTLAAVKALAKSQRRIVTLTYNPHFISDEDPRSWLATVDVDVKGRGATPGEALAALQANLGEQPKAEESTGNCRHRPTSTAS
jgi:hypothetical protein